MCSGCTHGHGYCCVSRTRRLGVYRLHICTFTCPLLGPQLLQATVPDVARCLCTAQALANACMAADPGQRPTFAEAHSAVDAKLAEVQGDSSSPPPQASSPFASAPAPKVALAR